MQESQVQIGNISVLNKYRANVQQLDSAINIMRGTIWGNPFSHLKTDHRQCREVVKDRNEAITRFRKYLYDEVSKEAVLLRKACWTVAKSLARGNNVKFLCCCSPAACHGDELKQYIEMMAKSYYKLMMQKAEQLVIEFDVNEDSYYESEWA